MGKGAVFFFWFSSTPVPCMRSAVKKKNETKKKNTLSTRGCTFLVPLNTRGMPYMHAVHTEYESMNFSVTLKFTRAAYTPKKYVCGTYRCFVHIQPFWWQLCAYICIHAVYISNAPWQKGVSLRSGFPWQKGVSLRSEFPWQKGVSLSLFFQFAFHIRIILCATADVPVVFTCWPQILRTSRKWTPFRLLGTESRTV